MKHTNWVRRFEHTVLRIASLVFSVVSAHAILWFFSALNRVDHLQPFVTWGIAAAFGVLGYFVSRGLAHRLLNREPVRVYIFICGVFELVEVVCNYAMAAVAVHWITWLGMLPATQRSILTFLTYVVLSIIPVVTVMLAWVDMDLDRAKQGYEVRGFGVHPPFSAAPPPVAPAPMPGFGGMRAPVQPKMAAAPMTNMQVPVAPPAPAYAPGYQQGYAGMAPAAIPNVPPQSMATPVAQAPGGWWNRVTSVLPFGPRPVAQAVNQQ